MSCVLIVEQRFFFSGFVVYGFSLFSIEFMTVIELVGLYNVLMWRLAFICLLLNIWNQFKIRENFIQDDWNFDFFMENPFNVGIL